MAYSTEQRQYNLRIDRHLQGICFGGKDEPYYDNEDDYGWCTYNYTINDLSCEELDLLFEVINSPQIRQ